MKSWRTRFTRTIRAPPKTFTDSTRKLFQSKELVSTCQYLYSILLHLLLSISYFNTFHFLLSSVADCYGHTSYFYFRSPRTAKELVSDERDLRFIFIEKLRRSTRIQSIHSTSHSLGGQVQEVKSISDHTFAEVERNRVRGHKIPGRWVIYLRSYFTSSAAVTITNNLIKFKEIKTLKTFQIGLNSNLI